MFTIIFNYLPSFVHQITSLILSGNDETSNLPELFLCNDFSLDQFNKLEYLKLDSISSFKILSKLLFQCQSLEYFSTIHINKYKRINEPIENILSIINFLWSLSNLKTCSFDNYLLRQSYFRNMKSISSSIENLFLDDIRCDINDIIYLFKYTINLQQISFKTLDYSSNYQTIETINFNLLFSSNIKQEINELINSFRSYFWIEEHKCSIRCRWKQLSEQIDVTLYTLPYLFNEFCYQEKCKSTCLNQEDFCLYNHVNILSYNDSIGGFFNVLNISHIYFSNIHHLIINFPFKSHFWSVIPSLNMLNSLSVELNETFDYVFLESLLDKTPNLYLLTVKTKSPLKSLFFKLKNRSIRRLNLNDVIFLSHRSFPSNDCKLLANSLIGHQCQVLSMVIRNQNDILYLIDKMINLRKLIFLCEDDKWDYFKSLSSINDNFNQWLQKRLPSTFSIHRGCPDDPYIHIWK